MSIFQVLAVLFGLFMLYVTRMYALKLRFSITETSFWYSLWGLFIVVSLFPDLLKGITSLLHFSRVFDLLLVGSLMVLTVVVTLNHFNQKETTRKWEEFIRGRAIDELKNKGL